MPNGLWREKGLCGRWLFSFWWEPRALLPLLLAVIPFHLWHKELHFAAGVVTLPPVYALLLCALPLLVGEGRRQGRAGALRAHLRPLHLPAALVALSLPALGQVWQWPAYGQGLWELAVGPLCLAAALLLLGPPQRMQTLGWALAGGGLLVALVGLAGWLQGAGGLVDGVTRLVGPHFSPNHTALYLLRSFWLSVALIWPLPPRWRWAGAGVAALQGAALLLTGSRGALALGVPAGALLLFWLILLRRPVAGRWLLRRQWRVMGTGLLLGLAVVFWLAVNWQRLTNVQTLWLRLDLWQATLALVQDSWRTGVGPGGFFWRYPAYLTGSFPLEPNQLHPHNVWLEWLVTWGVGGAVWLVGAIVLLVRAGARLVNARRETFWLLSGLTVAWFAALAHGQSDAFHLLPDLAAWNGAVWGLWWLAASGAQLPSGRATRPTGCNTHRQFEPTPATDQAVGG
jgi:O-antigen ligase